MNHKFTRSSINELIHYSLLYLLFIMNGSTIYRTYHDPFLCVILILSLVIVVTRKIKLPTDLKLYLVGMTVAVSVVFIINDGGIGISALLNFTVPVMFTYVLARLDQKFFLKRLVNVIVVMSAISLVYFIISLRYQTFLTLIMPFKFQILPWLNYYGDLFYVIRPQEINRNTGIFNEPGLYQMVLNLGLFLMLFFDNRLCFSKKKYRIGIIVLMVTIITTFSTSGYLGLTLIVGLFVLKEKNKSLVTTVICISAIIIFSITLSGILETSNFIEEVVFSKLHNLTHTMVNGGTSGSYRIAAMKIASKMIISHPLGCGFDKLETAMKDAGYIAYEGGTTATGAYLFRYIAIIGIVPGVASILWIFKRYKRSCKTCIVTIVAILLFLNTTLAQTDLFFPALLVPMFMENGNKKNI